MRSILVQEDAEAFDKTEQAIKAFIEANSLWSLVRTAPRPANQELTFYLTRTTPLLRFTDDIEVFLSVSFEGTRIEIKSQSRVGKGDLGQNPRNIRELNRALREQLDVAE